MPDPESYCIEIVTPAVSVVAAIHFWPLVIVVENVTVFHVPAWAETEPTDVARLPGLPLESS